MGWVDFDLCAVPPLPSSAQADGKLAELAEQGKMVEHGSPCISNEYFIFNFRDKLMAKTDEFY